MRKKEKGLEELWVDLVIWCPKHPKISDRLLRIRIGVFGIIGVFGLFELLGLFKDMPMSMQQTAAPVLLQSNYRIKRITELPN